MGFLNFSDLPPAPLPLPHFNNELFTIENIKNELKATPPPILLM
jgi:hypothetical protein